MNKPDTSKTLAIIPAFNEAKALPAILNAIHEHWPGLDVLVINDGSMDETAKVAREHGGLVVSHTNQMGYGASIQTGYKYAYRNGYDFLVQVDGDGQHEIKDIGTLLANVQDDSCDIAFGSRFLADLGYQPSFCRKMGIAFFRNLLWLFIRRRVSDPTTGFQAMNRKVLKIFIQDFFPCDYPDADVIILLNKLNLRAKELPVRMYPNNAGKSMHSNPIGVLYYVFKMVMSMFLTQFRSLKKY